LYKSDTSTASFRRSIKKNNFDSEPNSPKHLDFSESLFAIGGFVRGNWSADVHEINIINLRQRPRAPLPGARSRHAAAAVRVSDGVEFSKWITVCGGWNAEERQLRSCEIFNPRLNDKKMLTDSAVPPPDDLFPHLADLKNEVSSFSFPEMGSIPKRNKKSK
ncbi:unnamed protein product, partial [Dibothriocephalus latus]